MLQYADVLDAADRVADVARHTPLRGSPFFSAETGAEVHLKLENFQRTGAFKIRGAANRVATLDDAARAAGVVTASAGNHAQGVALAATRAGVDATVVMPEHAPVSKVQATEHYGGDVVLHGADYDAAAGRAHEIAADEGRTYVHAFDDEAVMAGQGTIGLEVVEDLPAVETVVVPVGGGGLVAGVATALDGAGDDVRVVGVEAEGSAKLTDSLDAGEVVGRDAVDTIADGIATRRVGERPFEVIRERVDEVVTVTDSQIATAVTAALERTKVLLEPAGAAPLAALVSGAFEYEEGEAIVPVCSGGNVDVNTLTTVLMRGLVETGRYLRLRTVLPDRPGALVELSDVLAEHRANIYAVRHDRTSRDIAVGDAEIELDVETRGPGHVEELLDALAERGYQVETL